VDNPSDNYPIWGREQFMASRTRRGNRDRAPESYITMSSDKYTVDDYPLKMFMPAKTITAADAAYQRALTRQALVEHCKERILRGYELDVAELLSDDPNYASGLYENLDTVADRNFDDTGGPGALRLLMEYRDKVHIACGMPPDTLVLSSDTWSYLSTDKNLFGGGSTAVKMDTEYLRGLLNLRQVLIADALHTTAAENEAAEYPLTRMWGSNMALFTISPAQASLFTPATGYTFMYNATAGHVNGEAVRRWSEDDPEGEYVEYSQVRGVKLASIDSSGKIIAGALLENCYAAI
jgi:hypothetical protein